MLVYKNKCMCEYDAWKPEWMSYTVENLNTRLENKLLAFNAVNFRKTGNG